MGEDRGFRHFSSSQVQLTPQAQQQIALNELDQAIERKQNEIRRLQKLVLAMQETRAEVSGRRA